MRPFLGLIPRQGVRALAMAGSALALGVAAAPAQAATPVCTTGHLVTWINTQSNGAAGTVFYVLNFTNVGPKCTLRGYPGVSAVGGAGRQLGSAATRNAVRPLKTITLNAPNASRATVSTAHATVGIVEVGNFSPSACGPAIASGLRVFPPNQGTSDFVPFPFGACAISGPKFLKIGAVTR
jgi:Protein of unknown function (DUF4232)